MSDTHGAVAHPAAVVPRNAPGKLLLGGGILVPHTRELPLWDGAEVRIVYDELSAHAADMVCAAVRLHGLVVNSAIHRRGGLAATRR